MSDQPGCPCSICDEDYMTDQSGIADLHTSTAPVEDSLRTRIASAISGVDDWRGVTDPAILADAVIRELDLAKACKVGCMWQIPNHIENMTDAQKQLLKIAVPPSWGTPSFDNGSRDD